MLQYLEQDLQSFIARELLVEITIGFLRIDKAAELLGDAFHSEIVASHWHFFRAISDRI